MIDLCENSVRTSLDSIVLQRKLLDHSYYRKWSLGLLGPHHLKQYAKQYFWFVLNEARFLSAIHSNAPTFPSDNDPCGLSVRQRILSNLVGEEQGSENHPALWRTFCSALGLTDKELLNEEMLPGTENLVNCFSEICRNEPFYNGIAAMYAFESQVPEIAEQKISGLKRFYGMTDPQSYKFFSVHQAADVVHSAEEAEILGEVVDSDEKVASVKSACKRAADALLGFMDHIDNTYCTDVVI